jgi:hypothetical protein
LRLSKPTKVFLPSLLSPYHFPHFVFGSSEC